MPVPRKTGTLAKCLRLTSEGRANSARYTVPIYVERIGADGPLYPLVGEWDNPTMIVTLDAKRRLTVPASLAPASPGDYFDASFDAEEDALVFRRLPGKENWLAVLKACPVSPDDLPRRRRAPPRRRKL